MARTVQPFSARVTEVIDGDTIVCDLDLGFSIVLPNQHFRLFGINAAEHGTPGGDAATAHLNQLLLGKDVTLSSVKNDKFGGRYDASISLTEEAEGGGVHLVPLESQLVAQQWAAWWDGRGEKPVPPWPRTVSP